MVLTRHGPTFFKDRNIVGRGSRDAVNYYAVVSCFTKEAYMFRSWSNWGWLLSHWPWEYSWSIYQLLSELKSYLFTFGLIGCITTSVGLWYLHRSDRLTRVSSSTGRNNDVLRYEKLLHSSSVNQNPRQLFQFSWISLGLRSIISETQYCLLPQSVVHWLYGL